MPKGYEKYNQGTDDDYYLGLGKKNVLKAKWDMLGNEILTGKCFFFIILIFFFFLLKKYSTAQRTCVVIGVAF